MINQLRSDYYVYCLYDKYHNVKYIGSGRGNRLTTKSKRKQNFKDIIIDGGKVEKVCSGLSRIDSINIENELLSLYRNQIINVNKRVRLLDYKFEYFEKFLELSDDSPTGLIWKVDISLKKRKGSIAGSLINGYFVVKIRNGSYQIHRVLYCLRNKTNLEHYQIINHIDFNPSNNSNDNLEVVTMRINCIKKNGYDSKEVGIRHRGGNRNCFESYGVVHGILKTKHFSIKKYGFDEARRLAEEARRNFILESLN